MLGAKAAAFQAKLAVPRVVFDRTFLLECAVMSSRSMTIHKLRDRRSRIGTLWLSTILAHLLERGTEPAFVQSELLHRLWRIRLSQSKR